MPPRPPSSLRDAFPTPSNPALSRVLDQTHDFQCKETQWLQIVRYRHFTSPPLLSNLPSLPLLKHSTIPSPSGKSGPNPHLKTQPPRHPDLRHHPGRVLTHYGLVPNRLPKLWSPLCTHNPSIDKESGSHIHTPYGYDIWDISHVQHVEIGPLLQRPMKRKIRTPQSSLQHRSHSIDGHIQESQLSTRQRQLAGI